MPHIRALIAQAKSKDPQGLVSTGNVARSGDKPHHTVINGENYHVPKALTFTHSGKVDAIYIDPPNDAVAKLKGLALHAQSHQGTCRCIEAVAEVDGTLCVLDLMSADVRAAIADATSAKSVYRGALARKFGMQA